MLSPIEILLVEDDEADALLTTRLLSKAGHASTVHTVSDGVEAMNYLRREAPYETAAAPDLVLLDLNMPRKDGRETLSEIKSDESLKTIPVVILSTSDNMKEVADAYSLHASGFMAKPTSVIEFSKSIGALLNYWQHAVKLPLRN